jgi:hypothetical protein
LMDIQNIATKYKQKEDALAEEVCGVRASLSTRLNEFSFPSHL